MSHFRILDLPGELTDLVAAHLEHEDLLNLRLAFRSLAEESMRTFSMRYFQNVHLFLNPDCLRDLMAIARHPKYSKHVHRLTITTQRINCKSSEDTPAIVVRKHQKEQEMIEKKYDLQALMHVLPLFTSLKTIHLTDVAINQLPSRECGVICGRHMFNGKEVEEWVAPIYPSQGVFETVFEALHRTQNMLHIELEMFFRAWQYQNPVESFDLNSPAWKGMRGRIQSIHVEVHQTSTWLQALQTSLSEGSNTALALPQMGTNPAILRRNIGRLCLSHQGLQHPPNRWRAIKATWQLTEISLTNVVVTHWVAALTHIPGFPLLESVYFKSIYTPADSDEVERFDGEPSQWYGPAECWRPLIMKGKRQIREGVNSLYHDRKEAPHDLWQHVQTRDEHVRRVDLRMALAFLDARA
jgi:hypothetical protein